MSQKSNKKNVPSGTVQGGRSAAVSSLEEFEPRPEPSAIPVWIFVLLAVLIYWGMIHLDRYGGGFSPAVYGPYESDRQLASLQPKSGPELLIAQGEVVYGQVCTACHQATGLGSPGQYPPLAGSEWVQGPPNRLIRIPLHGLTGTIEVKNETWEGKNMPAFGGTPPLTSDESLAAVLTFVRQAWGNKAAPITPELVKAVRAETASRTAQWTADELLKITP